MAPPAAPPPSRAPRRRLDRGLGWLLGIALLPGVACAGGDSGPGPDACAGAICDPCVDGEVVVPNPGGCCPGCAPAERRCGSGANACTTLRGCVDGYTRVEYAAGCCACVPDRCHADGAATCAEADCPAADAVVFPGDACCAVCVEDGACPAREAPCESLVCPPGFMSERTSGCCGDCVPDPVFCAAEKENFRAWLDQRLAESAVRACTVDEDCRIVALSSACAGDCGTSVAAAEADALLAEVVERGEAECGHCPEEPIGCPAVELTAGCASNRCVTR